MNYKNIHIPISPAAARTFLTFLTERYIKNNIRFSFKDNKIFAEEVTVDERKMLYILAEAYENGFIDGTTST